MQANHLEHWLLLVVEAAAVLLVVAVVVAVLSLKTISHLALEATR